MGVVKRSLLVFGVVLPLLISSSALAATSKPSLSDQLEQRVIERRTKLKLTLSSIERQRLVQRCKPAQLIIKTDDDKLNFNLPARVVAYDELIAHLLTLNAKLKAKGVDTKTLEDEERALVEKIQDYQSDLNSYKQALSDLSLIDCVSDPDGFKASLETARTLRQTLASDAVAVQDYVTKTIKPTLAAIRTQLGDDKKGV